eukprot:jgi/Mesvir1/24261/Mv10963-RA.1
MSLTGCLVFLLLYACSPSLLAVKGEKGVEAATECYWTDCALIYNPLSCGLGRDVADRSLDCNGRCAYLPSCGPHSTHNLCCTISPAVYKKDFCAARPEHSLEFDDFLACCEDGTPPTVTSQPNPGGAGFTMTTLHGSSGSTQPTGSSTSGRVEGYCKSGSKLLYEKKPAFVWTALEWGACNAPCGSQGERSRSIFCSAQAKGAPTGYTRVEDRLCAGQPMPPLKEPCNAKRCTAPTSSSRGSSSSYPSSSNNNNSNGGGRQGGSSNNRGGAPSPQGRHHRHAGDGSHPILAFFLSFFSVIFLAGAVLGAHFVYTRYREQRDAGFVYVSLENM